MFFRSSLASGIGGTVAGWSVIATAVDSSWLELRAALVALLTAAAIAATDYLSRRRKERAHEERFLAEHLKTRRAVTRAARRRQPTPTKPKNNG